MVTFFSLSPIQDMERLVFCVMTIITTIVVAASRRVPTSGHLYPRLYSLTTCPGPDNFVSFLNYSVHNYPNGEELFDTAFITTKSVRSWSKAKVTRCKDAVSFNTCEYYGTYPFITGVCEIIVSPGMPWVNVIKSMEPPFHCPLKKGLYEMKNASTNMDVFSKWGFHPEGSVWSVEGRFFDENGLKHLCFNVRAGIVRLKSRPTL